MNRARLPLLLTLMASALSAQEQGISRTLAKERAKLLSAIQYELHFDLEASARQATGKITIRFNLKAVQDVILDSAVIGLTQIAINGAKQEPGSVRQVNNHLVLPKTVLREGGNSFAARFTTQVASTGTPLTIYHDTKTKEDFVYTLVVPSDAHRLFPCFDQPDLKGRIQLSLTVPSTWLAVANAAQVGAATKTKDGKLHYVFQQSKPISTYLMAFAAGPFALIENKVSSGVASKEADIPGLTRPLRIFARKSLGKATDYESLFSMHKKSLNFLCEYFDEPYPFGKLDLVLCPGFPYGGMEHAGAIFYRESALVFDHSPTESELLRRSTLIYHEISHQWFGNLVTMEWFDDLWLKEGFATFMGYSTLENLEPDKNAWLRFHQRVKPAAYRVDGSNGTTAIYQDLANLDDAKSNYGPIVYNKAPSILRELESRMGKATFRAGVRLFLDRHAYANATWRDLLKAFEDAGAAKLDVWSDWWILKAGMPELRAIWREKSGKIASFVIEQKGIQGWHEGHWPMSLDILVKNRDGSEDSLHLGVSGQRTEFEWLVGKPAPSWILLNHKDVSYGRFLLDKKSLNALETHIVMEKDLFRRSIMYAAMYETVRNGGSPPETFAKISLDLLDNEFDPLTRATISEALVATISRYLPGDTAKTLRAALEHKLLTQLQSSKLKGLELQSFRTLAKIGKSTKTLTLMKDLSLGKAAVPGLKLGTQDRFLAVAALLASQPTEIKRSGLDALIARMLADPSLKNAEKFAYIARAARPIAASKEDYFKTYLQAEKPPEQWVQLSLAAFHWSGQEELTLPYLRRALEKTLWVKKHRKIFFMPAWIDSFVNAHSSKKALDIVEDFLRKSTDMPKDIRLKILQSADELRRAVRIRAQK